MSCKCPLAGRLILASMTSGFQFLPVTKDQTCGGSFEFSEVYSVQKTVDLNAMAPLVNANILIRYTYGGSHW